MLEAAPEDESGGNSRFTAGSIRVVYNGVDDIKTLVPDLTPAEIETTDFGTYTADQFFDDMARVTQNRADPDLVELLVTNSFDSLNWMREKGVRFIPIYGRQAFKIDGKFKFWGGLTVESVGGGPGLVAMLTAVGKKARHRHPLFHARRSICLFDGNRVEGVRVRQQRRGARTAGANPWCSPAAASRPIRNGARAISARAGTSPRCAASRFNTGDGIRMALDIGACAVRQLVGLPCRAMGNERAGIRRSRGRRSVPETLLSVLRSWSMRPASASSTRAPISATTPMPNTAAWCWSSRASSPGRSSIRR